MNRGIEKEEIPAAKTHDVRAVAMWAAGRRIGCLGGDLVVLAGLIDVDGLNTGQIKDTHGIEPFT